MEDRVGAGRLKVRGAARLKVRGAARLKVEHGTSKMAEQRHA